MVADMISVAKAVGVLALVAYLLIWTLMALVMLAVWEPPKTWIAWLVLLVNPVSIGIFFAIAMRAWQGTRLHA